MVEMVDFATAQAATGTRLVVAGFVPSPWSEAAKGLFRVGGVPVTVTRSLRDNGAAIKAWTGVDNVPVLLYGNQPARTCWAAIVGLVARLARAATPSVELVPEAPAQRAEVMGLIEMIAGEDGLGWSGRLAMVAASVEEQRGFPPMVGGYLQQRYAGTPGDREALRARVQGQLAILAAKLGDGDYYSATGAPNAVDVYSAAFLTPLSVLDEAACPDLKPAMRAGFDTARDTLGDLVPPALADHRRRMLERHLGWPIAI